MKYAVGIIKRFMIVIGGKYCPVPNSLTKLSSRLIRLVPVFMITNCPRGLFVSAISPSYGNFKNRFVIFFCQIIIIIINNFIASIAHDT